VPEWLESVDVVLFCEQPLYPDLTGLARSRGKRVVCVPNLEWTPLGGWVDEVDLFLCPTNQCYLKLRHNLPCTLFPWPCDTQRFQFRQRKVVQQFVFINGNGGWRGRKGGDLIRSLVKAWPTIPLSVYTQTPFYGAQAVFPETPDNRLLYREGDVLLSPHSVDG